MKEIFKNGCVQRRTKKVIEFVDDLIPWLPWVLCACAWMCAGVVITDVVLPKLPRLCRFVDTFCGNKND